MEPRKTLFYGWYVLASSFIILFLTAGARYSFGVMFKPMMAEFGWSRGSLSMAFFLNMAIFAFTIIVAGKFYDRYGPKWMILIATVFLLAGYGLMSTVRVLWQYYIYYGILVAIGLGGTSVPLVAAWMSKWFERRKGLAVSLSLAGNCTGQFALVPLFTLFALRFGWRVSYLLIGWIMFLVNVPLALFVIKGDPEALGYKPLGSTGRGRDGAQRPETPSEEEMGDVDLGGAMRTSSFWFFLILMFICGSGDFMVSTHLIPYATDHGISPLSAGNMLGWLGMSSLFGILIAGWASDRIGNKIPIALTFLLRVFSFWVIVGHQDTFSFYLFSLSFGLTMLVTAPLTPILVAKLYGFSHVGYISGLLSTVHHLGGGFWAYMGGWIFDRTGSYHLAFVLSAIMTLGAFLCALLIREKRVSLGSVVSRSKRFGYNKYRGL